jgi:predicted RNA-binding protein
MTRWLAISNRENSDISIKKNIWGVPKRAINTITRVKPGDTILMYVSQKIVNKEVFPSAITGEFEVVSEVYEDSSRIFTTPVKLGNELFPLRIKLKPLKIYNPPVEFKPLVPKLQFITNKEKWVGHIRGQAMREIPEEDYQLIINQASR